LSDDFDREDFAALEIGLIAAEAEEGEPDGAERHHEAFAGAPAA